MLHRGHYRVHDLRGPADIIFFDLAQLGGLPDHRLGRPGEQGGHWQARQHWRREQRVHRAGHFGWMRLAGEVTGLE